jgi:DNA-binding MarR family transcriptional regulator
LNEPDRDPLAASLQRFGLERDRMRAALARHAGITATDLDALEHLEADGPLTQRELGDRLSLTSGAITMLVDRLERAGWVNRRPHPSDRRYLLLELSPNVAERTPQGLAEYHAAIRTLTATVHDKDRETIAAFLAAAADSASAAAHELDSARVRPARNRRRSGETHGPP